MCHLCVYRVFDFITRHEISESINKNHQDFMECIPTPRANITYPLKFDGWKMKHPIKLDPFQGTFVHFRGVTGGEVQPKSTEMASRYRFNYWMNSQGLAAMGTILLSGAPGGKFASKTVALGGGGFKYFQCSTLYMVYLHIFTYMKLMLIFMVFIYRSWILWTSCLNWKCQGIQDTEVAVSCFVQHHTGPQKVADEGKSPLFPGHLGW